MKRQRFLLVLLLIFVGLIGLVLLQNARLRELSSALAPTPNVYARVYPDIANTSEVQAIRLQDPLSDAQFVLNRTEDDSWEAPANEGELNVGAAEAIVTTVVLLPFQRRLPLGDDLSAYGITSENGTLLIQIFLRDGSGHAVAVGALSPSGSTYYALVDDRDEVYLLERGAVDFLLTALRTPPVS